MHTRRVETYSLHIVKLHISTHAAFRYVQCAEMKQNSHDSSQTDISLYWHRRNNEHYMYALLPFDKKKWSHLTTCQSCPFKAFNHS
jgi:hypothetical protein